MRCWSTGARAEQVPSGATGDSSTPANRSGSRSHSLASSRASRRGSHDDGRTKRSWLQRCITRAAVTFRARARATVMSRVCRSVGGSPVSKACRTGAGTALQTRASAGEALPSTAVAGCSSIADTLPRCVQHATARDCRAPRREIARGRPGSTHDGRVGALVTLELPADSPAIDLPWIITFGPLDEDEEWEPVVCGPYERPHALAHAEEDDDEEFDEDEYEEFDEDEYDQEEGEGPVRAAVDDSDDGDEDEDELEEYEDEYDEDEDEIAVEPSPPPTPEEVRAGFARIAAKLTGSAG